MRSGGLAAAAAIAVAVAGCGSSSSAPDSTAAKPATARTAPAKAAAKPTDAQRRGALLAGERVMARYRAAHGSYAGMHWAVMHRMDARTTPIIFAEAEQGGRGYAMGTDHKTGTTWGLDRSARGKVSRTCTKGPACPTGRW